MIKKIYFIFNNNILLRLLSILFLLFIPFCYADNNNDDDNNNRRLLDNNAELLGWISISCGLIANVPFILYVRVKKLSVKRLGGG